MKMTTERDTERGFTLIEVLVVLALLAAIVAIVAPTVFSQLDKGDATRIAGDMSSMASGVKAFRVDVTPEYPGDLEDLVVEITPSATTTDASVTGDAYNSGQATRWGGPYVEVTDVASASSLTDEAFTTGFGASVLSDLSCFNTASATVDNEPGTVGECGANTDWVAVRATGLTQSDFDLVDAEADDGDGSGSGRFQFANGVMYFLAAQR